MIFNSHWHGRSKEYFAKKNIDVEVRLECPAKILSNKSGKSTRKYIDIVVKLNGEFFPIELKRILKPSSQGGETTARYNMLRDIERLEKLQVINIAQSPEKVRQGFVIWLTNNSRFWKREGEKKDCNEETLPRCCPASGKQKEAVKLGKEYTIHRYSYGVDSGFQFTVISVLM